MFFIVMLSGRIARAANRLTVSNAQKPKRSPVKDRWHYVPVIEVESNPVSEEHEDWELYYPPWIRFCFSADIL